MGYPFRLIAFERFIFQPLKDKVVGELTPWLGKHVATAGRRVLVKDMLTAIVIYHMTSLELPTEVLEYIDKLRHAYLWAGCDKVSGGKCKVNWEQVCKPKSLGGLSILNLDKFASALRLRWLWFAWSDPPKAWFAL